MKAIKFYCVNL